MIKKILLAAIILLAGLTVYVNAQSDGFQVSRSRVIPAPAGALFAQVNDFHNWQSWSPWADLDPDQKTEFSGANKGSGAVMSWDGNKNVGQGRNTIIESVADRLIRIRLEFIKPFPSESTAEFRFEPAGNGTKVTWTMLGTKNFMMKAIHLVMDCDKMVGGQFEEGLLKLEKTVR